MRSVTHASFTITRRWKASPARVFAAFADQKQKDKWFAGPGSWTEVERSFDFREGGFETLTGKWNTGMVTRFDCVYRDIVAPAKGEPGRIIYSYNMFVDEKKISVSQAAIEIMADGDGAKFVLTEYGDYLDGYEDNGSREHGTNALMDALEKSLSS
ncbi:MAG: SRPBCC domain-containing protein [Alphaproteobacteria bacterium]|nr:SRPBCC domain-containing protein [Alphaproteobacteria bacterium]